MSELRIGTAERTAAMRALDEHLEQGRLSPDEYGERSAIAVNARTASELAALFADLPAPHPDLPGAAGPPPPTAALPVTGSSTAPLPAVPASGGRGFPDGWGERIVAAAPLVALALFVASGFRFWWIWLLVPVAGALLYGRGRGPGRR